MSKKIAVLPAPPNKVKTTYRNMLTHHSSGGKGRVQICSNFDKKRPLPKRLKRLYHELDRLQPKPPLKTINQAKKNQTLLEQFKKISLKEKLPKRFYSKPVLDVETGYRWRFPFRIVDKSPKSSTESWLYAIFYLRSEVNQPLVQTRRGKKFRPATPDEVKTLETDLHECFEWGTALKKDPTYYGHRVVEALKTGYRPLPPEMHVHHEDFNTLNNLPENLVALEDWEHFLHHLNTWKDLNTEEIKEKKLKAKEAFTREQDLLKEDTKTSITLDSLITATLEWSYPSEAKRFLLENDTLETKDFYHFGQLLSQDLKRANLTKNELLNLTKQ